MFRKALGFGLVLALAGAGTSFAHDFWIQPAPYITGKDGRVAIRLFNGHGDERTEYPYRPARIVRLEMHGPKDKKDLVGLPEKMPTAAALLDQPGVYTFVYQSKHAYIELPPERFEPYVHEEGLDAILVERKERGEADKPGKESYARYCKALVKVGSDTSGFDRKVGLPLEVTAIDNPYAAKKRKKLAFLLEYQGKPLGNAYVEMVSLDDLSNKQKGHTDKNGRVTFNRPKPGPWMVATTYMRRAPADVQGDWESFWATLTFEIAK